MEQTQQGVRPLAGDNEQPPPTSFSPEVIEALSRSVMPSLLSEFSRQVQVHGLAPNNTAGQLKAVGTGPVCPAMAGPLFGLFQIFFVLIKRNYICGMHISISLDGRVSGD